MLSNLTATSYNDTERKCFDQLLQEFSEHFIFYKLLHLRIINKFDYLYQQIAFD